MGVWSGVFLLLAILCTMDTTSPHTSFTFVTTPPFQSAHVMLDTKGSFTYMQCSVYDWNTGAFSPLAWFVWGGENMSHAMARTI